MDVLGPLRAWLGDTEVALGTARQRATFAVLVGHAAEGVSYRDLVDGVWGACPPATAHGNLHTYISGLRSALGPARDLLATTARGYRLQLDEADVDSLAFARCRSEADRRMLAGDLEGAVDALTLGLGLWKGEAYAAVPGPFAELESQRLAEARVAALEQRARLLIEAGHHIEVVADAADLVREQPLRESAWELLVLALHRCGRHAEALAAAERARQTLADELGVPPGPDLAGLHARVRADVQPRTGRPASTATARRSAGPVVPESVQDALATHPRLPLLGRDADVDRLRHLVADVSATRTGRAVWIEGDVGTGKSALLLAGLHGAAEQGCALGWARADELLGRFDLQVVLNCFSADLAATGRTTPDRAQAGVEDRVVDLVVRACATAPLIMVVDDLHWADRATIRLWHRLIRATHDLPLLLVATSRPPRARADLDRLRQAVLHANGTVFDLGPLTAAESEQLIRATAGGCARWTAQRLAAQASGNPLRLVELGRALRQRKAAAPLVPPVESGAPEPDAGEFGTAEFGAGEFGAEELGGARLDVPAGSAVTEAQRTLLALSTGSVRALRAAALLGVEFAGSDLALVSELPPDTVRAALDEAIAAQVLVEEHGVLAFRTDALWRAAYERVPGPIRAPLRRQFAETLAAAAGPAGPGGSLRLSRDL
ncbi:BTAD domain-containing putative transcriptional regulator [Goodfellowiella coeruleoviolacea]|uniref:BTAD domain-containing putative transcriptional regulator n=1 Tax=Goodfellowiella coeruleoviolacea TaxID=334858 RepID=UPI0020A2D4B5|nr:BTAD domain-containing putative transcriptional regulator [Goodfellowiella coeruleoviolacea]